VARRTLEPPDGDLHLDEFVLDTADPVREPRLDPLEALVDPLESAVDAPKDPESRPFRRR